MRLFTIHKSKIRSAAPFWHGVQAFTAVELLVVIAILALLALLLFPVMQRMLGHGDLAGRVASLRAIGSLISLYAADHEGTLPGPLWPGQIPVYTPGREGRLAGVFAPYLDIDPGQGEQVVEILFPTAFRRSMPREMKPVDLRVYVMNMAVRMQDGKTLNPWGSLAGRDRVPQKIATVQSRSKKSWALAEADQKFSPVGGASWGGNTLAEPLPGGRQAWFFDGSIRAISDSGE